MLENDRAEVISHDFVIAIHHISWINVVSRPSRSLSSQLVSYQIANFHMFVQSSPHTSVCTIHISLKVLIVDGGRIWAEEQSILSRVAQAHISIR